MCRTVAICIKYLQRAAAVLIVAAVLGGCKTEPITMRVIDAATGSPVAGAVAVYELHSATGHGTIYTQHVVSEAVSDDDGWIRIPALNANVVISTGLRAPTLKIFRSGYDPVFLVNHLTMPGLQDVLKWDYNGQTVKLVRASSFVDYARKVEYFNDGLRRLFDWPNDDPCGWKAIPQAIMAIEREMINFEATGKRQHNSTVARDLLGNEASSRGANRTVARCGSPNEFFAAYPVPCPDGSAMMQNISRRSLIDEVSQTGTSIVLYTLGYCPSDGRYWLHRQGGRWTQTSHKNLDFLQDKRRAK